MPPGDARPARVLESLLLFSTVSTRGCVAREKECEEGAEKITVCSRNKGALCETDLASTPRQATVREFRDVSSVSPHLGAFWGEILNAPIHWELSVQCARRACARA